MKSDDPDLIGLMKQIDFKYFSKPKSANRLFKHMVSGSFVIVIFMALLTIIYKISNTVFTVVLVVSTIFITVVIFALKSSENLSENGFVKLTSSVLENINVLSVIFNKKQQK